MLNLLLKLSSDLNFFFIFFLSVQEGVAILLAYHQSKVNPKALKQ
jgi:hypothetical protein